MYKSANLPIQIGMPIESPTEPPARATLLAVERRSSERVGRISIPQFSPKSSTRYQKSVVKHYHRSSKTGQMLKHRQQYTELIVYIVSHSAAARTH